MMAGVVALGALIDAEKEDFNNLTAVLAFPEAVGGGGLASCNA